MQQKKEGNIRRGKSDYEQTKNIRDGCSTALYAAYTVDTVDTIDTIYNVDTVDIIYTVDMAYTINMVYIVDMVYAVDTVCTVYTRFKLLYTASKQQHIYMPIYIIQKGQNAIGQMHF